MSIQWRVMRWRTVFMSLQAVLVHALLFIFTLLLALKLDRALPYSWWSNFSPLWLFHVVAARGKFSLPAPSMPHDCHWAPLHTVIAMPLLVAFELLLCIRLESSYVVNLKIIFLPFLAFETAILIDNIRMCRALMLGDEENISDEAKPFLVKHFWVEMIFIIAATIFTLLKLCVLQSVLLFLFAQSLIIQQFTGILASENPVFLQYLLHILTKTEGTPPSARHSAFLVIFAPFLSLQGTGVLFAAYRLVEKISLLGHSGAAFGRYWNIVSKTHDCLGLLQHGSRLLGWWSIDEDTTLSPDIAKKLPKSDLIDEILRL